MEQSQQPHKGKNETRHNEGFKAARNLESTGIPRDQAEAIVKTATSEAILIVNTHALSKEDFGQEMKGFRQELNLKFEDFRQEMNLKFEDFRQELDKRDYVTRDQLVAQTAQIDTKFANLETQMAQMETRMGQRMAKFATWSVGLIGSLIAFLGLMLRFT
ncbi:MAG: hypothetical protein ACR2PR_12905 [Pseudohongiellaceae bacterium]